MASAQVLPSAAASTTKKQELLAAGKRRLDEFRKKKALEKGKNAASARQSQDSDDNHSSLMMQVRPANPDDVDVGSLSGAGGATDESMGEMSGGIEAVQNNDQGSSVEVQSVAPMPFKKVSVSADQDAKLDMDMRSKLKEDYKITESDKENCEESGIFNGQQMKVKHTISEPNYYRESASYERERKSSEVAGYGTSFENQKIGSSFSFLPSPFSTPTTISEPFPSSFKSDSSLSDHALVESVKTSNSSRRSRPSFLDSIKVTTPTPFPSPAGSIPSNRDMLNNPLSNLSNEPMVVEAPKSSGSSSADYSSLNTPGDSVFANNGSYSGLSNGKWKEHENKYRSVKQNEDFSALEQHIEDLTREKFSLQRAIEASRALAESLASENSTLTDSYNQQGSAVNQLRFEMEQLRKEIRGQSVELEAVKSEYGNALLECNAADERAKLLASEVISLEEKALRLRSNELKLEQHLETAISETSTLKKKISTLGREHEDLHASIAAFQEEKKLLQSKLQKLSSNGSDKVKNSPSIKKNVSTSTDDLVNEDNSASAAAVNSSDSFTRGVVSSSEINDLHFTSFPENIEADSQFGSVCIPSDQMGVIQNIAALISELALEKEELIRTLKAESSECSKFKELNKELSKRLEIQTQRLELLTAQSMAGENVVTRQTEFPYVNNPVIYADEGDEVVERVLGWIMMLFPRGPSKRRTSKLI